MKDVRDYLKEAPNPRELLPELLARVQRDAFSAGYETAAGHMFEIAESTSRRIEAFDRDTQKLQAYHG